MSYFSAGYFKDQKENLWLFDDFRRIGRSRVNCLASYQHLCRGYKMSNQDTHNPQIRKTEKNREVDYLELTTEKEFQDEFVAALHIPHSRNA